MLTRGLTDGSARAEGDVGEEGRVGFRGFGGEAVPESRLASARRARQRLRRPPLCSGPSGDTPGPLRLRGSIRGEHRKATGELVTTGALRHGVEGGLELVALFPSPSHGFLVTERAAGTCGWRERAPWGRFGDRPADPLRVLDL